MNDAGRTDDTESTDDLHYELVDGIARITLNRPDAANALTPDQRDRLVDLFADTSADLRVRVVVLGAAGKHFCTGADLRVSRIAENPRPDGAPDRALGDLAVQWAYVAAMTAVALLTVRAGVRRFAAYGG